MMTALCPMKGLIYKHSRDVTISILTEIVTMYAVRLLQLVYVGDPDFAMTAVNQDTNNRYCQCSWRQESEKG